MRFKYFVAGLCGLASLGWAHVNRYQQIAVNNDGSEYLYVRDTWTGSLKLCHLGECGYVHDFPNSK